MIKKIGLLFLGFLFIGIFGLLACRKICQGPFPNKLKVSDLDWHIYEAASSGSNLILKDIHNDSVYFNMYSIQVSPIQEPYIGQKIINSGFNFINSAYACSPSYPEITDETMDSIVIKTNKDFNINYPQGADLSDLFDIVLSNYEMGSFEIHKLNDYVKTNPFVPKNFTLILREEPASTTDYEFHVQYYQKGIDYNFFEFTTEKVVIVKE